MFCRKVGGMVKRTIKNTATDCLNGLVEVIGLWKESIQGQEVFFIKNTKKFQRTYLR